jgi:Flp pilus assembly protein TadB
MSWQRAWMVLAAGLLITAVVLLWRNNLSAAFITAALGACAWFLSYRAQLRSLIADEDEPEEAEFPEESNED